MHFFYLDESGDTGDNLNDPNQPIFVLGGVSLRDEGWNKTQTELHKIFDDYFEGEIPENFELHTKQLLSPNGEGPFQNHDINDRTELVQEILDLIEERKHGVHFVAIDKNKLCDSECCVELPYNTESPYLVAFDYLVTYINWNVKERLGSTARALVIFDRKDQYHAEIEKITRNRRFEGPKTHRIKWIVEFSYSVDSKKNSMIQLSDLIVFLARRFMEIEKGYHPNWSTDACDFYASCYDQLITRVKRQKIVDRSGRNMNEFTNFLKEIRCTPSKQWRRNFNI